MLKNSCYLVFICCVISFFTSCKDSNEYNVNSSFADYLQRFETEGTARGHTFDLKSKGLIIEFANLKDNTAGLTHYEKPIRIEIDKTYWNDISKSAGADLMKENLIFHELGHGLLDRKHLNTTLANGDWKSIMCGGDKVNNRSWNINYRGMRRSYYIDELFNESTPAPDFSSLRLPVDTAGYNSNQVNFNFDNAAQSGWKPVDFANYSISIGNGQLKFISKVSDVYLVYYPLDVPIPINTDFTFEITISYPAVDLSGEYGLIFSSVPNGSTGTNDQVEYFSINNNQKMYTGNRTWYSYFTELSESSIVSTGNNKLKIVKTGQVLYYFINNVYCYSSEIVANSALTQFGFMVPPNGVIYVDNMQISKKGSSGISSKSKVNMPVELNIQRSLPLNLNKVKNQ